MDLLPLQTLASAVALTGSFAVVGNAMDLVQSGDAALVVTYAPGTGGTGMEYIVEVSLQDTPTTWVPLEESLDDSAAASGGDVVAPASRLVRSIDGAGELSRLVLLNMRACRWLRIKARETGTITVAGTITATGRARVA